MPTHKQGKRNRKWGRKKSRSAAQERYRSSERLKKRKIRNLMKHKKADGSQRFKTEQEAEDFWIKVRKRKGGQQSKTKVSLL